MVKVEIVGAPGGGDGGAGGGGGSEGGGANVHQVLGTVLMGGASAGPLSGTSVRDPGVNGRPMLRNDPRTDRNDADIKRLVVSVGELEAAHQSTRQWATRSFATSDAIASVQRAVNDLSADIVGEFERARRVFMLILWREVKQISPVVSMT